MYVITAPHSPGIITELDITGPPHRIPAIETLSGDVLLEIFDLCLVKDKEIYPWRDRDTDGRDPYDGWYTLAHVCRSWRYVVFASPRRLNLRLHCSQRRVREMLCIWPAFPIVIWDSRDFLSDDDNIISALEHRDRVCEIKLRRLTCPRVEKLVPFLQKSFPALTKLSLEIDYDELDNDDQLPYPNLPDLLLGGSAPHLRSLCLSSMIFPTLPKFLLSASNLVYLYLHTTPYGYFSSETVAALSALSKPRVMHILFMESYSLDEVPAPAPLTRSVLPALNFLELSGVGVYLDDFVGRIDVPSINYLEIGISRASRPLEPPESFHDFFHLPQFIGRVETLLAFDFARFHLSTYHMDVTFSSLRRTHGSPPRALRLDLSFVGDGLLPALVEACETSLLPHSNIEKLHISARGSYWDSQPDSADAAQWLEFLRHFSSAKSLYLGSRYFVPTVAFALKQATEEGITGVLPAIQKLTVCGSLPAGADREAIEQFVAARGLSSVFETPASSRWRIRAQDT